MTPALTQPGLSHEAQAHRQPLQPAGPRAPFAALGAAAQMRVECRRGDARRQLLAVDARGYSGTKLTAMHPAIVPGTGTALPTGGRRA